MIPISEIFVSIQGEGPLAGTPCVFVRVGGCNFKCPGFGPNGCDSNFSVDAKYKKEWKLYSAEELFKELGDLAASNSVDLIVFTGGEPLIHLEFMQVAAALSEFFKVQIETNGSKLENLNIGAFNLKNSTFVVSPKLANSRNNFDYSSSITRISGANLWFKFVIGCKADIDDVLAFMFTYKIPKSRTYFMPLGESLEQISALAKNVWEACIQNGVKYSDRLHIRIYNDKRGV